MNEKKKLGQYFTKKDLWLKTQIIDFIKNSNCTIAYDPFAGNGDLLKISNLYGIHKVKGLDIDKGLNWEINDSLKNIPHIDNAIIIALFITRIKLSTTISVLTEPPFPKVKKYKTKIINPMIFSMFPTKHIIVPVLLVFIPHFLLLFF